VTVALGLSAFQDSTKVEAKKPAKPLTNHYFQYKADAPDTEAGYENPSNWLYLSTGNPGTDPCDGANEMVCVLEAAFGSTPTETDLTNYLSGLSPSTTGAETYCRNGTNVKHYKPEPAE
jgi:hypothetical protein